MEETIKSAKSSAEMRKKMENGMEQEIRTDLALEMRERFQEDDVEVSGVALDEEMLEQGHIRVTTVKILDEHGADVMRKPIGTYITVEAAKLLTEEQSGRDKVSAEISRQLRQLCRDKKCSKILIAGLGNREVTPDSLGPIVTDHLLVTRHLILEYGAGFVREHLQRGEGEAIELSAVAPGVMAQTGMEAMEILKGIAAQTKPELVIAVDALAARSVERLNTTVQLTDTGICPGSGIGNNRRALNEESIGCPVFAIGVPTVVDALTIVRDSMEELLRGQGYLPEEIHLFLKNVETLQNVKTMFVTPKSIDEAVHRIGSVISQAINDCFFVGE